MTYMEKANDAVMGIYGCSECQAAAKNGNPDSKDSGKIFIRQDDAAARQLYKCKGCGALWPWEGSWGKPYFEMWPDEKVDEYTTLPDELIPPNWAAS